MIQAKVVSVNVGRPREVLWKGNRVSTSIFKSPVEGPIEVKRLNLRGDQQADLQWAAFGENLTTEGLREESLYIGDQLRIGSTLLMVTQPRVPCYKLTIRFDRDDLIKRFIASNASGFYFAVIEEGLVTAGDEIKIEHRDPAGISVADINHLYYEKTHSGELLRRAVDLEALPEGWRQHFRQRAG